MDENFLIELLRSMMMPTNASGSGSTSGTNALQDLQQMLFNPMFGVMGDQAVTGSGLDPSLFYADPTPIEQPRVYTPLMDAMGAGDEMEQVIARSISEQNASPTRIRAMLREKGYSDDDAVFKDYASAADSAFKEYSEARSAVQDWERQNASRQPEKTELALAFEKAGLALPTDQYSAEYFDPAGSQRADEQSKSFEVSRKYADQAKLLRDEIASRQSKASAANAESLGARLGGVVGRSVGNTRSNSYGPQGVNPDVSSPSAARVSDSVSAAGSAPGDFGMVTPEERAMFEAQQSGRQGGVASPSIFEQQGTDLLAQQSQQQASAPSWGNTFGGGDSLRKEAVSRMSSGGRGSGGGSGSGGGQNDLQRQLARLTSQQKAHNKTEAEQIWHHQLMKQGAKNLAKRKLKEGATPLGDQLASRLIQMRAMGLNV